MTRQRDWKPATAEVVSCRIAWPMSLAGAAEDDYYTASTTYIGDYDYEVEGTYYRGSMYIDSPHQVGETFQLTYDPARPGRNSAPDQTINLRRPGSWIKLIIWVGMGMLIIYLLRRFFPGN